MKDDVAIRCFQFQKAMSRRDLMSVEIPPIQTPRPALFEVEHFFIPKEMTAHSRRSSAANTSGTLINMI